MNVDEEQVKNDWLESEGQFQIKTIAQFYGVYEHLFGLAYFLPRIQLDIKVKQLKFSKKNCEFTTKYVLSKQYAVSEDEYAPVYYGNTLKPTHAKNQPEVTFDAKKKLTSSDVRSKNQSMFLFMLNFLQLFSNFLKNI